VDDQLLRTNTQYQSYGWFA